MANPWELTLAEFRERCEADRELTEQAYREDSHLLRQQTGQTNDEKAIADFEKVREDFERADRRTFGLLAATLSSISNSADTDAEDGDESDD